MYRTTQRCPVCKSLKWEHHYLNILKHLSPHTSCISRPNSLFLLNYFLKMTVGLILFCSLRCAMLCTVQYNAMFSLGIFYCFFLQQFHFKGVCCLDRGWDVQLDRWRVGHGGQSEPYQHIQVLLFAFHLDFFFPSANRSVEEVRDLLASEGEQPDNSWWDFYTLRFWKGSIAPRHR